MWFLYIEEFIFDNECIYSTTSSSPSASFEQLRSWVENGNNRLNQLKFICLGWPLVCLGSIGVGGAG